MDMVLLVLHSCITSNSKQQAGKNEASAKNPIIEAGSNFKTSNFTAKALMLSPKPMGDLTVATSIFDIQSVVANAVFKWKSLLRRSNETCFTIAL